MNVTNILQTFFAKSALTPINDRRRLRAVIDCANALNKREELTLTGLGRGMESSAKIKHCIKRSCRLLGNPYLQRERVNVYRMLCAEFLKGLTHPLIIVDWSPVGHVDKQLLRASVPIGGRAFTLYEEVHPERLLGSVDVHHRFLKQLAEFVPEGCTPIISTDAGFKVPWFKPVEEQNWYWLGRVRGNSQMSIEAQHWQCCDELFEQATHKPEHLGEVKLTRKHQHPCQATLYLKRPKGRTAKRWSGGSKRDSTSLEHAKREREPWLLVSNLPEKRWPARRLVALYTERMQIEESFRDTKNERYGLALNFAGTRCEKRLQILLMISMLTQFALMLIGKSAYIKGYYKDFQANTVRERRVLSYFFLGKEICGHNRYVFTLYDLALAFGGLKAKYEGDWL